MFETSFPSITKRSTIRFRFFCVIEKQIENNIKDVFEHTFSKNKSFTKTLTTQAKTFVRKQIETHIGKTQSG